MSMRMQHPQALRGGPTPTPNDGTFESIYGCVPGVLRTRVGYAGGDTENACYMRIGDHSESMQVDFDPKVISFEDFLKIFWANHDPTGSHSRQYRSAILCSSLEQMRVAELSMKEQQAQISPRRTISTAIEPLKVWTNAEDQHQKYMLQRNTRVLNYFKQMPFNDFIESTVACRLNGYLGGNGSVQMLEKEIDAWNLPADIRAVVVRKVERGGSGGSCAM